MVIAVNRQAQKSLRSFSKLPLVWLCWLPISRLVLLAPFAGPHFIAQSEAAVA
jgi:hypothetical protein